MNERQTSDPTGCWWVVANPAAGQGAVARHWSEVQRRLADALNEPVVRRSEAPGQAAALAQEGIARGYRRLLAVGGDGTCHELLNGIFRQQAVSSRDITLSVLPVGTGNDWARTHHIPHGHAAWKRMIRQGRQHLHDAGRVDYVDKEGIPRHRYFLNAAGLAFDAHVVQQIGRASGRRLSTGYYFLLLLRHLMSYEAVDTLLRLDQLERRERFFTIEAGIGRYIGGGLQLMPHADPTDGRLAVTLVEDASKADILLNLWRFFNGSIGRHQRVRLHQVRSLHVAPAGDNSLPIEVDGEFLGWAPAHLEIIEAAFQVLTP